MVFYPWPNLRDSCGVLVWTGFLGMAERKIVRRMACYCSILRDAERKVLVVLSAHVYSRVAFCPSPGAIVPTTVKYSDQSGWWPSFNIGGVIMWWVIVIATGLLAVFAVFLLIYSLYSLIKWIRFGAREYKEEAFVFFLSACALVLAIVLGFLLPNSLGWGDRFMLRLVTGSTPMLVIFGWLDYRSAIQQLKGQGRYQDHAVVKQKYRGLSVLTVGGFFGIITALVYLNGI